MWGLPRVEHVYSHRPPGPGLGHRSLPRQRAERGEPGQGLRAAVGAGLHPAARTLPPVWSCTRSTTCRSWPHALERDGRSDRLRPLAAELAQELSELTETSKATSSAASRGWCVSSRPRPHGGQRRHLGALTERPLGGRRSGGAGTAVRDNREMRIEVGPLFRERGGRRPRDRGACRGRPVYVRDVARVVDGPDETTSPSSSPPAPRGASAGVPAGSEHPAVTLALAKRQAPTPPPWPSGRCARWRRCVRGCCRPTCTST